MSGQRVGIVGIGRSAFRRKRDASLNFEDIEAVIYSLSPNAMVGIGNAERAGIDAVGGRSKPFLCINTGGTTGISSVIAAWSHVAAGAYNVVLTAGADKVGECGDSQTVLNEIWDPTYERQLPLGTINMLGVSAVRYMHKYDMTLNDMAKVVVKNRAHAALNPNAHLSAMVLASERYIKDRGFDAVWISGLSQCAETYYLGDRMGVGFTADHADAHA